MKFKRFAALAVLCLFCGAGFYAGRRSAGPAMVSLDSAIGAKSLSRSTSAAGNQEPLSGSRKASRPSDETKSQATLTNTLNKLVGLLGNENALDRNRALLAMVDQLDPRDFRSAVAVLQDLDLAEDRRAELAVLLTAWAQADPMAAMAYAKDVQDDNFSQNTILTTWATKDPEAAVRWAKSNFQGDGANPYLAGIIRGIAQSDTKAAANLLTGMPRSVERGEALDYILPHYLAQGTNATRDWISSLKDDSLRDGAMERSSEKLAQANPGVTAAWLIAHPGRASQQQMDDVYSIWAEKDNQAAVTSFEGLPAGENRTNALRGIVTRMASGNTKRAVALMDRYPDDVTDRMVQGFIWHSAEKDTSTAASQIARLKDEGRRDQMYRRLLSNWLDHDPSAAQTWMANNPLSDAIRTELNNRQ